VFTVLQFVKSDIYLWGNDKHGCASEEGQEPTYTSCRSLQVWQPNILYWFWLFTYLIW